MIRKGWGPSVLEVFQVNRDMMETSEQEADARRDISYHRCKDNVVAEKAADRGGGDNKGDVRVRNMSEDDAESSNASSGAKAFPERSIMAGNREAERRAERGAVATASGEGSKRNNPDDQAEADICEVDRNNTENGGSVGSVEKEHSAGIHGHRGGRE